MFQAIKYKFEFDRKRVLIKHIKKYKPNSILEIGVFNGIFTTRMLNEAVKYNEKINYVGVDLFQEMQSRKNYESEASLWPKKYSEIETLLKSNFGNASIQLMQGYSKDELSKLVGRNFDLIFIDGGHSEETVSIDWEYSKLLLSDSGFIFFDDYTNRNGELKGKFGVRKIVKAIDKNEFKVKIYLNRDFFEKKYGILSTRLVRVSKR